MINLFVTDILLKDNIFAEEQEQYPLNIPALRYFNKLKFTSAVTILNGENGCGKSTLIEAIADQMRLPTEGGNSYMGAFMKTNFTIGNENAPLSKYIRVCRKGKLPKYSYFFRAESFHELSSLIDEDAGKGLYDNYLVTRNFCSEELLGQSHGESFMDLLTHQISDNGFYLLDEPESALSPTNQIKLLCLIDTFAKRGCQFIIATHSPILLGYRDAVIINMDDGMKEIAYKDTNIYKLYSRFLANPEKYQKMLLDDE